MKKLLIVDYGSYFYKDVIACMDLLEEKYEQCIWNEELAKYPKETIKGIVLTGSPGRIDNPKDPQMRNEFLDYQVPILGICYGMQALMHHLGGKVEALPRLDKGDREMTIIKHSPINKNIEQSAKVHMAHYDHVTCIAPGFEILAHTALSIAMIANEKRKIYAVQYHPEANKSKNDMQLLSNFCSICNEMD